MGKAATKAAASKRKPPANSSMKPREVAASILKARGGGEIGVRELADLTVKDRRVKGRLKGKTPAATVAAQIYVAASKGDLFKKAGRGMVKLAAPTKSAA